MADAGMIDVDVVNLCDGIVRIGSKYGGSGALSSLGLLVGATF